MGQLEKYLIKLNKTFRALPTWQQVLIVGGFLSSIYFIITFLGSICVQLCCARRNESLSVEIPKNIFDARNDEELEKIRNKRLEKFENFKKKTIVDQMNVEAQLAKQLGL